MPPPTFHSLGRRQVLWVPRYPGPTGTRSQTVIPLGTGEPGGPGHPARGASFWSSHHPECRGTAPVGQRHFWNPG